MRTWEGRIGDWEIGIRGAETVPRDPGQAKTENIKHMGARDSPHKTGVGVGGKKKNTRT